MKKLILLSLVTLNSYMSTLSAQDIKRTWHWNFGDLAGLDFSSGSPVSITNSALYTGEGCSSISDTNGNLLFYTDGRSVWNKNNVVMPNGTGLDGDPSGSSTQEALIVPQPLNDSIFFVFTTDADFTNYGLNYSVVNMNLNGGFGDVIKKNVHLLSNSTEKLAGTKCSNDTDIWIMGLKVLVDTFYAFKVSSLGVDSVPVTSQVVLSDSDGSAQGCMKFSPTGRKVALGFDFRQPEVADFNSATGIVSNPLLFPFESDSLQTYGVEFSPDESKLYWTFSMFEGSSGNKNALYQANLLAGSDSAIISSTTFIDSIHALGGPGALQIGPDGKIYIAKDREKYLGVINLPNLLGIACNYKDSGLHLSSPTQSYLGLPNFVSNYFFDTITNITTSIPILQHNQFLVYPNPTDKILYINTSGLPSGLATLSVIDVTGREVLNSQFTIHNSQLVVDVSSLQTGMYFIAIKTTDNCATQKFIKE